MCDTTEHWKDLIDAIILQAIEDYRLAIRNQWVDDGLQPAEAKEDVENFLHSEYFRELSKLDPDALIELMWFDKRRGEKLIAEGDKVDKVGENVYITFTCPICGCDKADVASHYKRLRNGEDALVKKYRCPKCNIEENRTHTAKSTIEAAIAMSGATV